MAGMAARTLQQLVADAASLHPDRVAVTYDGGGVSGSRGSLLYRDLAELSADLAGLLWRNCGAGNGVIGLCCCDDLFVPVWILGILQCPAAYVPLDQRAPGLLTARVMSRCGLKYCAVKTDILQRFQAALGEHASVTVCVELPGFKLTLVQIKLLSGAGTEQTGAEAADGAGPCDSAAGLKEARHRDLAYVLHTSGTTGLPKIVRVPHKCILPNILHLRSLFQVSADDVVFLASPLTFDPSVVDIFLALSSGAQLLIVPTVMKKMPGRLAQLLFRDHRTTVLQVTPTLLVRFGDRILKQEVLSSGSSLRVLALGGEACPSPALLRSWKHEDNRTHIYNIYGITEVSCWACSYRVPEALLQSSHTTMSCVPLGTPLMGTVVEVRDERGCVVAEGEGQLFIGGEDRVCLLDDEETPVPGTMRPTGDWVSVQGAQLCHLGRKDRLIKRHGKRVNLDSLQQLILGVPQVEACAVCLHGGVRLLAFIVASTSAGRKAAPPPTSDQRHEGQASSSEHGGDDPAPHGVGADLSSLVLKRLSMLLPPHSVPDTVLLVPALCLTPHGKVDMEALVKIYQRRRQRSDSATLKQTLQSLWKETLGLPEDQTVDEESNFLLSGGDSLKALLLCEDVLAAVGVTSPELLEVILDGTFSSVLRHVERVTPPPDSSNPSSPPEARERHADTPSAAQAKRKQEEPAAAEGTRAAKVLRRAGEVMAVKIRNPEASKNFQADASGDKDCGQALGAAALSLSLSWSSDTGRCVDASPVLLAPARTDQGSEGGATAFIGSHSHRIQALDVTTGSLRWERVLGGRIEASAAVSRCGSLVVIGCYDGCVYFLCATSGATRWTFETGDAVKSAAAVDAVTGLVVVGSHDGSVYALKPQVQQCVWRRHCGGGAVFSSPCLHPSLRQLYVATLGGHLLCLNPDSGEVLWSYRGDVPFFSSPNASSGHVIIGSVDGNICCFSSTGKLVWRFLTKGPVFSSPCVTPDRQRLLCGSHDGHLYCLNCADGSLVWTFQTTGRVFSSPWVSDGGGVGRRGILAAVASTDGTVWILDGHDGQMLASFALPGELFSSPVLWEQFLVVGCRNDYVYCLKVAVKEET